jgi:hypothetical protein
LHVDGEISASEISYLMVDDIDYIRELLQALSATIVTQDTRPTDVGNRPKRAAPRRRRRGRRVGARGRHRGCRSRR